MDRDKGLLVLALCAMALALGPSSGCLVDFVLPGGEDASAALDATGLGDATGPGDASATDPCTSRECGTWAGVDCGACGGDTPSCDAMGRCVADLSGLTWVVISSGTYDMGSTTGEGDEQPIHSVAVETFEMTRTEVTVAQYRACVDAGHCSAPDAGDLCNWEDPGYEEHPVNCVDWNQATAYCTWAAGRLPTEAEWEYAARSEGQDIEYPWGNDAATCSYAVIEDGGRGCGTGRTMPVCSKPAGDTAQGLCDMAGNVWEWVEDDYHDSYAGAPVDGSVWLDSPRAPERVGRGGGWRYGAVYVRVASRDHGLPSERDVNLGFRCAR